MNYPDENRMLIIRPCIKAICLNIKPASQLLSHLLYLARNCSDEQIDFTFSSTQEDLLYGLIDEMDVKTLHRTAIPVLRMLGFLEVNGSSYRYEYTVHLAFIQQCLLLYKNKQQLEKVLIVSVNEQLDKLPNQIDICPIQLGICLIHLDIFLIPFRQMSNSQRGRKPTSQATAEALSQEHRLREINKITKKDKRVCVAANADNTLPTSSLSQDEIPDDTFTEDDIPTAEMPAVKGVSHGHDSSNTPLSRSPGHRDDDDSLHDVHAQERLTSQQPAQAPPRVKSTSSEQAAPGDSETPSQCAFCPEEAQLTCLKCGRLVCYEEHGRYFPSSEEEWCIYCLDAHNKAMMLELAKKEEIDGRSTTLDNLHLPGCSGRSGTDYPASPLQGTTGNTQRAATTQRQSAKVETTPPGVRARQGEIDGQLVQTGVTQGKKGNPKAEKPAPESPPVLSVEGKALYEGWCSLFKVPVRLDKSIIKAANWLAGPCTIWADELQVSQADVLKTIKNWLYANDKTGYYKRGVRLYDVEREFEGWQSAQERPESGVGNGRPQSKPIMNNGYDYGKILFQLAAVEGLQ